MSALLFSAVRKISACFAAIIFTSVLSFHAHAVVINFDDLTYVPENPDFPSFGDVPLGDQYRSQGLLIDNAFLLPYAPDDDIISWKNYLLAGAMGSPMTLRFVGELPTYVGMYLGGNPLGVLYTSVYDQSGVIASHEKENGGWEYVSFESATGISRIEMFASQQTRVSGAVIDDITYTYASVSEPSSLGLLLLAALALFNRRTRA
jgi:hypothetical protein